MKRCLRWTVISDDYRVHMIDPLKPRLLFVGEISSSIVLKIDAFKHKEAICGIKYVNMFFWKFFSHLVT